MVFENIAQIVDLARRNGPKRVAVAGAASREVLLALRMARDEGFITAVLIGDGKKIAGIAATEDIEIGDFQVEDIDDEKAVCARAAQMASAGEVDFLMKGFVTTSNFVRAVLNRDLQLMIPGRRLSHLSVFEMKKYRKLLFITDDGINIAPTIREKITIIRNAIDVLQCLGIEEPKIACLAAMEQVDPDQMPATVDAAILSKMSERGQIRGAVIDGPLAFDNAISAEHSRGKKIATAIGGDVDVVLMPDIEAGNILYKCLTTLTDAKCAGLDVGARVPMVQLSRTDTPDKKYYGLALAVAVCNYASCRMLYDE